MWKETNNQLSKSFEFIDFSEAWAFMNSVALIAEREKHHPNWCNIYNKVDIRLTTHDAGNIVTQKDKDLANEIDKLLLV
jgi:4a-hydroxytetrahydrobiopterin dehydratase